MKFFKDYKYVQSLQVTEVLSRLKTRIKKNNLPHNIKKLQCVFIESFGASLLAVSKVFNCNRLEISEMNGKGFFTLSHQKYPYCVKKFKRVNSNTLLRTKKDL
jgi:hypothetical protein